MSLFVICLFVLEFSESVYVQRMREKDEEGKRREVRVEELINEKSKKKSEKKERKYVRETGRKFSILQPAREIHTWPAFNTTGKFSPTLNPARDSAVGLSLYARH